MTTATPLRNLMVYFGDIRAAKKRQRRLAVVDGNFQPEAFEEEAPRFAFIRIAGTYLLSAPNRGIIS